MRTACSRWIFSDKTQNVAAHSVHPSSGYPLSHTLTCESICQPYISICPFTQSCICTHATSSNVVDKSSRPISTGSSILIPVTTMNQKPGRLNNRALFAVIYLLLRPVHTKNDNCKDNQILSSPMDNNIDFKSVLQFCHLLL